MAEQPPAIVVLEACGSAHYWARELARLGHEIKSVAPQYVKPFVKRQKNDAADAEAIVIAAQRPEMRFVEAKSPEQQSRAMLFRSRQRLVRQHGAAVADDTRRRAGDGHGGGSVRAGNERLPKRP